MISRLGPGTSFDMELELQLRPKVGELKLLRNLVGEEVTRENALEQHLDESTFVNVRIDTVQHGLYKGETAALIVFRFIFNFRSGPRRIKNFNAKIKFASCVGNREKAPMVKAIAPEYANGVIMISHSDTQVDAVNEVVREHAAELRGWRQSSDDAIEDEVVWDCIESNKTQRGVRDRHRGVVILQVQSGQRFQASFTLSAEQATETVRQRLQRWMRVLGGNDTDDPVIFYPGDPIGHQYSECRDFSDLNLLSIAGLQGVLPMMDRIGSQTPIHTSHIGGDSTTSARPARSPKILRVRLIPANFNDDDIRRALCPADLRQVIVHSRAEEAQDRMFGITQVATVQVHAQDHESTKIGPMMTQSWRLQDIAGFSGRISIDHSFMGMTVLQSPKGNILMDLVAVSGLNGHAFGSWKQRGGEFMWLRDGLKQALQRTRILTYGYDSRLSDSHSYATISNYGQALLEQLVLARATSKEQMRPLVFLGHSLGGLAIKETIVYSSRSGANSRAKYISDALHGLIFFGVPHRGLHVESLKTMVKDQANQALVESLEPGSAYLNALHENFVHALGSRSVVIHSWYETMESQTVKKIGNDWKLEGPWVRLVSQSSATNATPGELPSNQHHIDRSHSEMVKFGEGDSDLVRIRGQLHEIENVIALDSDIQFESINYRICR